MTVAYIAPFLVYIGLLQLGRTLGIPAPLVYCAELLVVGLVLAVFSRPVISLRPRQPLASVGIGVLVFVVWIAPDLLFHYRHSWLFDNFLTGSAASSLPPDLRRSPAFVVLRTVTSAGLVPILEELFWRAWLMRWLIRTDFEKVPLGTYAPQAFWVVAVLFAAEHGPYWEVGLAAGIVYNWWMIRTHNLADCILAHAVTNAVLSAYVLIAGQWQYWL